LDRFSAVHLQRIGDSPTQMRTMVLEYESQHVPQKSSSFVGKYTSTMEQMGYELVERKSKH
jgi:hypothetical protein